MMQVQRAGYGLKVSACIRSLFSIARWRRVVTLKRIILHDPNGQ